jgi:hypothetical protein
MEKILIFALIEVSVAMLLMVMGAMLWTRKMKGACAQDVALKLRGVKPIQQCSGANYFGLKSLGMFQMRGNGELVLTGDGIFFQMWMPRRQVTIPLSSILEVTTTLSHLGKSKLRPLLKVVFINADGRTDSAAWLVRDLEAWKQGLDKARSQPEAR